MHFSRNSISLVGGVLLAIFIVACSPAVSNATEGQPIRQDGSSGDAAPIPAGNAILAWVGAGSAPGTQSGSAPGELVLITGTGDAESILALPQGTGRVEPCGNLAQSRDGAFSAFYVGDESDGTVYLMQGTDVELITAAEGVPLLTCVDQDTFQIEATGKLFAYIDYPLDASRAVSPRGRLRIKSTVGASEVANFENVTAFDLTETAAAFLSFFYDDQDRATEVAISVWDGTTDREIATLIADEGFFYTSASVTQLADGRLAATLGYREINGSVQWQLYVVDVENRAANLVAAGAFRGSYFPFTGTNTIYDAPDGSVVHFTYPDGVTNFTAGLASSMLGDEAPTVVVERDIITASTSDLPYDANNHAALTSPDGQYLAFVQNTPNNEATLTVVDLSAPDLPPITLAAGDRGDTISEMIFTPDSTRLLYVAGESAGGDNSLFTLDLATGTETRLTRGRFAQGVIAPDGERLAMMQWISFDDEEPPYLSLVILDVATGDEVTVFEGGEVVEGELENAQFIYPLSWRG